MGAETGNNLQFANGVCTNKADSTTQAAEAAGCEGTEAMLMFCVIILKQT